MATLKKFTLKSGAELQVQPAAFEPAVALVEAVAKAILGKDAELQLDQVALFDPGVRKAVYDVLPWAIYNTHRMSLDLFSDPALGDKLCGDWFEIAGKIVEVNRQHFFPKASSGSSLPEGAITHDHRPTSEQGRP